MTSRADQLYRVGEKAWEKAYEFDEQLAILAGVAAMLAEATRPKSSRKAKDAPVLPVSPAVLYEAVRDHCEQVLCVPYNKRWFGMLGRAMQAVDGFEAADVERLVAWIQSGALNGWPTQLTFDHVIKHLPAFIMRARSYEGGAGSAAPSVDFG